MFKRSSVSSVLNTEDCTFSPISATTVATEASDGVQFSAKANKR
jgi:hypothetical protein